MDILIIDVLVAYDMDSLQIKKMTIEVKTTSLWRQNDVNTSFWRNSDLSLLWLHFMK